MDKTEETGCGGKRCCAGKAAFVLVLLLIGGLIGYGMGRCHTRMGCHYTAEDCPMAGMKTPPPAK